MSEVLTEDDARYAYELVERICTEVGPGVPGSAQERARAAIIKQELEAHLGAGNVVVEEFSLAPRASLSLYPGVFLLLAVLLNLSLGRLPGVPAGVTAVAALLFSILVPLVFTLQFVLGWELIDPLFKQKPSVNVIGTLRKPDGSDVKQVLLLGGHHDSAPENTWLRLLGYGFYFLAASFFIGFVTMLAMSILQITGVAVGHAGLVRAGTLGWAMLVFPMLPAALFGLTAIRGWKDGGNVPGAADNLSACALVVAMCRFLVKNLHHIPAGTEIRFVSFGSEEVGLRGSRRYVARHLEELKRLDARLLNYDTVAHPQITILASDLNGTVKHSSEMVKSVVAAAERAGVPHKVGQAYLGVATDAAPFSRAGLQATTLLPFKVPQQMVAFYHQKWDGPELLTTEPLLNVLKLTLQWVRNGGDS